MKQKITTILFLTALVLTFASCLGNDDDDNKDYSIDYKNAIGPYSGKMYALDFTNPEKTDTLKYDVTATVTADSVITFSAFPLKYIIKELSDTELREAVIARGNTVLKAQYAIYGKEDSYLYTFIYPQSVVINDIDYKGGKHKVTISFAYPSEAIIYPHQYLETGIYVGGVFLDDVLLEDFINTRSPSHLLMQFLGTN